MARFGRLVVCGENVEWETADSPEELARRIAKAAGGSLMGTVVSLPWGLRLKVGPSDSDEVPFTLERID